jgi:hypothetical protein
MAWRTVRSCLAIGGQPGTNRATAISRTDRSLAAPGHPTGPRRPSQPMVTRRPEHVTSLPSGRCPTHPSQSPRTLSPNARDRLVATHGRRPARALQLAARAHANGRVKPADSAPAIVNSLDAPGPRPARLGGGTVVRPMGARTAQRQEQHHPDQRHVHQAPHHHHGPSNQQPAAPRQENRHIVQTVSPRNRLGRIAASACCCLGRRWAVRRRRQGRSRYARSPAASRPPSHANHRYRIDLNMFLRRS